MSHGLKEAVVSRSECYPLSMTAVTDRHLRLCAFLCAPSSELSILRQVARVQITPRLRNIHRLRMHPNLYRGITTLTTEIGRNGDCTRHGENAIPNLPMRSSMLRLHLPSRTRRFVRLSLVRRAPASSHE